MTARALLLLVLSGLPGLGAAQTVERSARIQQLTAQLARAGSVESQGIGFSARPSVQYMYFDSLRAYCTEAEIRQLVTHQAPAVRCYAFWALTERPEAELWSLLAGHRRDFALVRTRFGCNSGVENVADLMLSIYEDTPQYQADSLTAGKAVLIRKLQARAEARSDRHLRRLRSRRYRRHMTQLVQRLDARRDD